MSMKDEQSANDPFAGSLSAEHAELGTSAQERSQAYWLLSRLFLKVPDAPNLLQLQADLSSVVQMGPLGELQHEVDEALLDPEKAAVDFTRRLLLADKASGEELPYECYVRERTIPGAVTAEVVACMRDAGFGDICMDAPSPDHIGPELKFMAMLCYEEGQAWFAGKETSAKHLIAMERHFMSRHIAAWAPDYCEGLEERAAHAYMKAVARLTRRCLLADVATIEEMFIRFKNPERNRALPWKHRRAAAF